jgi:biotin synthase
MKRQAEGVVARDVDEGSSVSLHAAAGLSLGFLDVSTSRLRLQASEFVFTKGSQAQDVGAHRLVVAGVCSRRKGRAPDVPSSAARRLDGPRGVLHRALWQEHPMTTTTIDTTTMTALTTTATATATATAATTEAAATTALRTDWTTAEIAALFERPFLELVFQAQQIHLERFPQNAVQRAQLLSIKTGGCSEDCGYCPQSARYDTGLERETLMPVDEVVLEAKKAKENGASRYCLGAAWRSPKDRDVDAVCEMVKGIKGLGMEACVTLGMLTAEQAQRLKAAGLDYYNHNIDTSPEYYPEIITTRTYDDRLQTLQHVRSAGVNVCSGGIVGMGETRADRVSMLKTLATLPEHPGSVPINMLVKVKGTKLALRQIDEEKDGVDGIELVRTIAVARILMPATVVRLSAGREQMSDELQALCFLAGANSVFWGDTLLTTKNNGASRDERLFDKLGLVAWEPARPERASHDACGHVQIYVPAAAE